MEYAESFFIPNCAENRGSEINHQKSKLKKVKS